jgi:histidine triad (HIT) family protein
MSDCIFCKIATHAIPVKPVYEDDLVIAFPDLNPQAPIHILIIPKQHFDTVEQAPPELLGTLLKTAATLGNTHLLAGHRIVINTGPDGGQTVHHLHLHLLGGREMTWPPG